MPLSYFLDNWAKLKAGAEKKSLALDWDRLSRELKEFQALKQAVELLRRKRKQISAAKNVAAGKKIKTELSPLEKELKKRESHLKEELLRIPNPPLAEVPAGGPENSRVLDSFGQARKFSFSPQDHLVLGRNLGILDVERGTKSSGSRFYFLKNEAVEMEWALVVWLTDLFKKEGWELLITPELVKKEVMLSGGFLPFGEDDIYYLPQDELYLIGTAEQSILGYHLNETLPAESLPLRYLGFSTSFRREAGSYGKDIRGIIRTHQFDKLEMFSFCHPQKGEAEQEYLISLEEKILQALELPYRKVLMAAGDLGLPAAKKVDLEVWLPSQKRYLEITSCSNCTDFQARRGEIRFKSQKESGFVYTLNGTAAAIGRMLAVIWENYQEKDGSVVVPKVLQPYLTFRKIASQGNGAKL